MDIFNWSLGHVALLLSIVLAILAVAFAVAAWRIPLFAMMGFRNMRRRPLRAALIVVGLMIATLVMGSALGAGDTIAHTLRTLVAGSLGAVDEVVIRNPPRNRLRARLQALTQPGLGGLAAAGLDFFPEEDVTRIANVTEEGVIADIVPAIVDSVTVVHSASQQLRGDIPVLAVASSFTDPPQVFGPLPTMMGSLVALELLGQNAIVLNAAAAESFDAAPGQELTILRQGEPWTVRIQAVSENGAMGGSQPLILVPLVEYQRVIQRQGQINLVLVANRGGVAGVLYSKEAAQALRRRLVDREVAQELKMLLARPDVQRGLRELEGLAEGADRTRLAALLDAAARPDMTDEFISLITDPRVRSSLQAIAWRLPGGRGGGGAYQLLQNVADLSVLEIKQETLTQANEYGVVVTTVFLVLGVFSVAAAILLILLIFAVLAADRDVELATLRALGMRRRQVIMMFLWEGIAYNILGAALGVLLSLLATYGISVALSESLEGFGIQLEPYTEPRSLLIAFAGGVLLTFTVTIVAAWRVSRIDIVAGARGESIDKGRGWRALVSVMLMGASAAIWWRWSVQVFEGTPRHPLVVPLTLSLLLLSISTFLWLVLPQNGRSWLTALTGTAVVGIWLRLLLESSRLHGTIRETGLIIAVAGVALIIATVWTTVYAVGPLLRLLDYALSPIGRLRALVRPASSYLIHRRGRASVTMLLFGMVIFIMVAALTVLDVLVNAYSGSAPPVAGFDLRADIREPNLIPDLNVSLSNASAVSRASFSALGGVTLVDMVAVQLGLPRARWVDTTLAVVDDGFVDGVEVRMDRRAAGYNSDRAVWEALRNQPGMAVITGRILDGIVVPGASRMSVLEPFTIWVRPRNGGNPVKLTVIGVVTARSDLPSAIYTFEATAAETPTALPAPDLYFLRVQQGVRVADAARGLQVSFGSQGMSVTVLGEVARLIQEVRLLLVRIVQGFMGLGLFAGVAALGLQGVQAVIERRQQIGALRALGFTGWQTRGMLAIESAIISVMGIATGTVAGLILARSLVGIFATGYPELTYAVPWVQIITTTSLAWLGSTVSILLVAWQAGKISPAEALRSS